MEIADLPALNASLNAFSALLLALGWAFVRAGRVGAHKACMLAAFGASTAFLISYLTYHYHAGSVPYTGTGGLRVVYFTILVTHVILAAVILPLALVTLVRGVRGRIVQHKRIGRLTLPLWLYVSVTGVVIYAMLYGF